MTRSSVAFLIPTLLAGHLLAGLSPASLFGDHMVLQRGMPVPVWGRAAAGDEITVRFAGHTVSTNADRSGRWQVALPALEASAEGREMTIEGSEKIVYGDVLVGEVWICSGQSNMQYGWGKSSPFPRYNWGGDPELQRLAESAKSRPLRSFHVPPDASFSPMDQTRGTWYPGISGSAVAFGFSYKLQEALDVPVAVIVTCWGSSYIEGWMPLDMADDLPHFKLAMEELLTIPNVTRVNHAIEKGVRDGFVWLRKRPNLLYNAMLHPLMPYACRGMVWYQGEANAGQPDQYAVSLPLWVQRIREGWAQDSFHFMAVMLPGYGQDNGRPDNHSWAWIREAQKRVLALDDTVLVNTIDLGEAKNIHPSDKAPLCERLALAAREKVYGESIVSQGPVYKSSTVNGSIMTVAFENGQGLATRDGAAPKGFWLCGEDRNWGPADAAIEGDSIRLQSAEVPSPSACRYAFCGTPDVNLVNGAGLPAFPFRTDDWKE